MKSKLKVSEHSIFPGEKVIEVWWNNRMIMTVTGADKPGVRILSKYMLEPRQIMNDRATPVYIYEVGVKETD